MLSLLAVLLACGGPAELDQPNPPPDPWPMSRAVKAAAGQVDEVAPAPSEDAPVEGDAATTDEEAEAPEATPPEAPEPGEGTRPGPP